MDRLKCLEIFVRVVEAGSFAAVTETFGMTAPMIGRHVRALESRLGTQLINRTTRRHSLTEAGRIYYERAKAILAELEGADESVALMRSIPKGVLKVGAPISFGSSCLAPLLPDYLKANPDVQVELTLNNRVLDLMEEGYDVVVRTGSLPDSSLITRSLAPCRLIVCAAPAYLEHYGTPLHPEDLLSHSCLGFNPGAKFDSWLFTNQESDDKIISVKVTGRMSVNNGHALREAAIGGAGIILQTEALLLADLNSGRLVKLLEKYPPPLLPLSVLYSPTRAITPKLRSFLDFLTAKFGANR